MNMIFLDQAQPWALYAVVAGLIVFISYARRAILRK